MAIFLPGTRCVVSVRVIASAAEAVTFPAFVPNEADPLFIFNDAVVHAQVFAAHPLAAMALRRLDEAQGRNSPAARRCFVCSQPIEQLDHYIGLGHLVDDEDHPLHRFNYAHFHKYCLETWSDTHHLIDGIKTLESSGTWKGDNLKNVLQILNNPITSALDLMTLPEDARLTSLERDLLDFFHRRYANVGFPTADQLSVRSRIISTAGRYTYFEQVGDVLLEDGEYGLGTYSQFNMEGLNAGASFLIYIKRKSVLYLEITVNGDEHWDDTERRWIICDPDTGEFRDWSNDHFKAKR